MKRKLGEILVAAGAVTQRDLDEALRDQSNGEPARLGDLLVSTGRITSLQLAQALSEQYALPFISLPVIAPEVIELVPLEYQMQHRLVPLSADELTISLAVADPANTDVFEEISYSLNRHVVVSIAPGDEIDTVHAMLGGEVLSEAIGLPPAVSESETVESVFGSLNEDAPTEPIESVLLEQDFVPPTYETLTPLPRSVFGQSDEGFTLDVDPDEEPTRPGAESDLFELSVDFNDVPDQEATPPSPQPLDEASMPTAPAMPAPQVEVIRVFSKRKGPVEPPAFDPQIEVVEPSDALPEALDVDFGDTFGGQPKKRLEWSGQLDKVLPSKLIVATVKALVSKGVLAEDEILAALEKK